MPDIKSEYETIEELEKAVVESKKKEDILISDRKIIEDSKTADNKIFLQFFIAFYS